MSKDYRPLSPDTFARVRAAWATAGCRDPEADDALRRMRDCLSVAYGETRTLAGYKGLDGDVKAAVGRIRVALLQVIRAAPARIGYASILGYHKSDQDREVAAIALGAPEMPPPDPAHAALEARLKRVRAAPPTREGEKRRRAEKAKLEEDMAEDATPHRVAELTAKFAKDWPKWPRS